MFHIIKDERLCQKWKVILIFTKQFDGLTWLTRSPIFFTTDLRHWYWLSMTCTFLVAVHSGWPGLMAMKEI